ncbi:MAG: SDR family oxidoreductase [Bacteroidota bacterium]
MSQPTIFISGASKGIGLGIARLLYQNDYRVVICARGQAALDAAKAEMPKIHTYVCDIADKEAVKRMAVWLNETFGPLDVLVNNGGNFQPGQLHSEADEVYEAMMATNMDSAYYLTKGVLPLMMEQKKGTVVNIASIASINAYANGGSYGISKFAMLGFSKNLREEMKPHNIRVISIMPGAVRTASWDGVDLPEERFMPVEDVAQLVWALCSLTDRTVVEDIVLRPALGDI